MNSTILIPAEVFPAGEYLRDELDARGWSDIEFAQIIARPPQAVSEIINGKKEITAETAVAIADALGSSAELWLGLQTAYRLRQVRTGRPTVNSITRLAALRTTVPLRELRRRGWIANTEDPDVLESGVRDFLAPLNEPGFLAAARKTDAGLAFTPEQSAWIARVLKLGQGKKVRPFHQSRLEDLALELPRLVQSPEQLALIEAKLAKCGVVLVIEPQLAGSKLDGVALLRADGTRMVGLTTRGDRFDSFMFTLLHELAHIVLGHLETTGLRIDEGNDDVPESDIEQQANERASNWIFPDGFSPPPAPISIAAVHRLSSKHGVHPSIVIGRLQRDGVLEWSQFRRSIPKVRPVLGIS